MQARWHCPGHLVGGAAYHRLLLQQLGLPVADPGPGHTERAGAALPPRAHGMCCTLCEEVRVMVLQTQVCRCKWMVALRKGAFLTVGWALLTHALPVPCTFQEPKDENAISLGLLMLGLPLLVLLPFPSDLIRAIQEQATFM